MKKSLKIAGIVLAVILVIMIVLPFAFKGKIEEIVKTEGNKMLNAEFNFKSLDISLFKHFPKASVTLNDFWLKGINEFENDTLLKAGELTATINLFSLFGDSGYEISRIGIKDTWAKAIVLETGKANWDIMKESEETTEGTTDEPSSFKIQLKKLSIDNLNAIYDDRQGNMLADVQNIEGAISGDMSADRTTMKIDAAIGSLNYKMGGIPLLNKAKFTAKMNIDADMANNKYTLEKNEFTLNAIKAGIDGWVALKDPAMEMNLNLNTSEVGFKEILSLIPAIYAKEFSSLKTDGTVTLSAQAKGVMEGETLPQFSAVMEVKNAMFRYPSLPAGVDNINILAKVSNPGGSADRTEVIINPFNFRLGGNPFGMTAEVKTPISDANFKGSANGVLNLGMIKDVYPLEDMELNGTINANMSVAGRMSYIEKEQYDKFNASGTIKLSDMKLKMQDMPDVDIHQSLFTFTPQYLQLSETTVNIGSNDITADCRFENYMGYVLKNSTIKGNLNINSNNFNLNDFMSDAEETVAETDTVPMSLIEIPKNIDFNMNLNMKKVLFGAMNFSNINGKLLVKNGKADMSNLSLNTMGGGVVMNGYYSTTDINKPVFNASFRMDSLSFAQTYKELDMVKQLAPVFENLKGKFTGSMKINTQLDSQMSPILSTMQGEGKLSTKGLSLSEVEIINKIADAVKKPEFKNISVKDMAIDFSIKDGRLGTQPFDIKWKDYNMNLSGTTGLDQTIDYTGKIQLPASAGKVAQLSTVDLKIGGSFTSPKISVDTESMAKQAVDAVKDQAVEKVTEKLGEKLGLDSTIVANKDSLKEEIKEKATEKAKDALKDIFKKKK
ncbi:AsmA-like C-terminal region-containing protein [Bacteroides sp. 519]|uniref:AsmA-like C-terminal region-containing protein n=1 Tax=Bacteroides sp. 519 TaxID=2302937 RepID=UPI0013D2F262|nr:AsmA-like C-terminal region-containing protein [Bacteroides sp. 519]NDV58970.1 AsmA family protein [Bacteroides sp. 519]